MSRAGRGAESDGRSSTAQGPDRAGPLAGPRPSAFATPDPAVHGRRAGRWQHKPHRGDTHEGTTPGTGRLRVDVGNTEQVAEAVARGLRLEGLDAGLFEVGSAPAVLPDDLEVLVVGAPTHAFSLSRPTTRADAVRQGAPAERERVGLREWLASVRFDPARPPHLAVFDTRIAKVRWLPKAAGPAAVRVAHKHGLRAAGHPVAFTVSGMQGPLVDGELERAVAWGRLLHTQSPIGAAARRSPGSCRR